ncbi:MAG: hypothetical protein RBU45_17490, partial [Myxococcota bacterium]|nr:hypothetical protein [Myxococcota bacterium]
GVEAGVGEGSDRGSPGSTGLECDKCNKGPSEPASSVTVLECRRLREGIRQAVEYLEELEIKEALRLLRGLIGPGRG